MSVGPELIGVRYSPWTEKARWALDHHGIGYRFREHLLIVGMPALRLKMRRPMRELTVPALVDGETRIMDSLEIAFHGDRGGKGSKLFPDGSLATIRALNELSEEALDSIRALVMCRVARDPEALREALPPMVPGPLRGVASAIFAPIGISYLDREFGASKRSFEEHEGRLERSLREFRARVAVSGYTVGTGFTFGDIAAAVCLQGVLPVDARYLRIGPATRRCWTDARLAQEFRDLIEWRDGIYARHRSKPDRSS